ncbi:hypothetical protein H5410_053088 [Solanum commersonii]|uniref:Uncharacterized protein n=1 Tax=Solanum commersonii TaxID=4109 RepID=A0A9J5X4Z3_SOLCO|nr:hypothetical protein H5410_053088 [Solanum commersonii]
MAQEAMLGKAHRGKKAQSVVLQENSQVETELNNPETPPKVTMEISKLEAPEHWADVVHTSASSISNAGFKLDYVVPEMQGEIPITVIELGDIEYEI